MMLSGPRSYYDEYVRKQGTGRTLNDPPSLLTDRGAYVNFLEVQLERVSAACLGVQAYEQRFNDMQGLIVALDQRCTQTTRLLGLAQQCAEEIRSEADTKFLTLQRDVREEHRDMQQMLESMSSRITTMERSLSALGGLAPQLDILEKRVTNNESVITSYAKNTEADVNKLSERHNQLGVSHRELSLDVERLRTDVSKQGLDLDDTSKKLVSSTLVIEEKLAAEIAASREVTSLEVNNITTKFANEIDLIHKEVSDREEALLASIQSHFEAAIAERFEEVQVEIIREVDARTSALAESVQQETNHIEERFDHQIAQLIDSMESQRIKVDEHFSRLQQYTASSGVVGGGSSWQMPLPPPPATPATAQQQGKTAAAAAATPFPPAFPPLAVTGGQQQQQQPQQPPADMDAWLRLQLQRMFHQGDFPTPPGTTGTTSGSAAAAVVDPFLSRSANFNPSNSNAPPSTTSRAESPSKRSPPQSPLRPPRSSQSPLRSRTPEKSSVASSGERSMNPNLNSRSASRLPLASPDRRGIYQRPFAPTSVSRSPTVPSSRLTRPPTASTSSSVVRSSIAPHPYSPTVSPIKGSRPIIVASEFSTAKQGQSPLRQGQGLRATATTGSGTPSVVAAASAAATPKSYFAGRNTASSSYFSPASKQSTTAAGDEAAANDTGFGSFSVLAKSPSKIPKHPGTPPAHSHFPSTYSSPLGTGLFRTKASWGSSSKFSGIGTTAETTTSTTAEDVLKAVTATESSMKRSTKGGSEDDKNSGVKDVLGQFLEMYQNDQKEIRSQLARLSEKPGVTSKQHSYSLPSNKSTATTEYYHRPRSTGDEGRPSSSSSSSDKNKSRDKGEEKVDSSKRGGHGKITKERSGIQHLVGKAYIRTRSILPKGTNSSEDAALAEEEEEEEEEEDDHGKIDRGNEEEDEGSGEEEEEEKKGEEDDDVVVHKRHHDSSTRLLHRSTPSSSTTTTRTATAGASSSSSGRRKGSISGGGAAVSNSSDSHRSSAADREARQQRAKKEAEKAAKEMHKVRKGRSIESAAHRGTGTGTITTSTTTGTTTTGFDPKEAFRHVFGDAALLPPSSLAVPQLLPGEAPWVPATSLSCDPWPLSPSRIDVKSTQRRSIGCDEQPDTSFSASLVLSTGRPSSVKSSSGGGGVGAGGDAQDDVSSVRTSSTSRATGTSNRSRKSLHAAVPTTSVSALERSFASSGTGTGTGSSNLSRSTERRRSASAIPLRKRSSSEIGTGSSKKF